MNDAVEQALQYVRDGYTPEDAAARFGIAAGDLTSRIAPAARPAATSRTGPRSHPRAPTTAAGVPPAQPESSAWDGDPLPLGWATRLPAFPIDALPGIIGRYAAALSVETQTPPDLAGAVVLGTLAACIGGRVRVAIRRGWTEPTNTYTVPVLAPGSRKSAVVAACEVPLDLAEKVLLERMQDVIRDAQVEREIREKYADQLKAKAGKSPDPVAIMEAQEAARVAAEVEVPAWPRLLTDDSTPEQLVKLMADQRGRIAAITAEAGIFDNFAGRYAARINLEPLLKAHAGDSIRVDRRSRDPERVDRPALTMIATIQPYALRDMVTRPEFSGRGLLARVLWCLPADVVGYRDENAPPVPDAIAAAYQEFIEDLAVDMARRKEDVRLALDEPAYKVLIDYLRQVEVMLRPDGLLGSSRIVKDWGSKLVGAVARISGALHIARAADSLARPIDERTMEDAVRIGEYFRAHAIAALGPTEDARVDPARKLLEVALSKGMASFTMRELCRRMPRGHNTAEALSKTLDYLTELGWIRKAGKGWEMHPRAGELLNPADTADTADSTTEIAGQSHSVSVSTSADTADTLTPDYQIVSSVSTAADRSYPAGDVQ